MKSIHDRVSIEGHRFRLVSPAGFFLSQPKTSLCEPTKFLEYINEMCQEYNLTLTSVDEVSALIKGKDGRVGVLQKTSD